MNKTMKWLTAGAFFPLLLLADLAPQAPLGLAFVRDAAAVVGMPATPGSVAGVARRTTRRTAAVATTAAAATTAAVATTAAANAPPPPAAGPVPLGTVIDALPAGCVATPIGGVEYYNCGPGVYYRSAFQGDNLVYVATQP